ncbi:MAG: hypothetical protein R3B09_27030, partial [Nannocystaceae bacterium]
MEDPLVQPLRRASTSIEVVPRKKRKKKKKGKKEGLLSKLLGRVVVAGAEAFSVLGDAVKDAGDEYARRHRKSRRRRRGGWRKDLG